jgi:hypothetical protein
MMARIRYIKCISSISKPWGCQLSPAYCKALVYVCSILFDRLWLIWLKSSNFTFFLKIIRNIENKGYSNVLSMNSTSCVLAYTIVKHSTGSFLSSSLFKSVSVCHHLHRKEIDSTFHKYTNTPFSSDKHTYYFFFVTDAGLDF